MKCSECEAKTKVLDTRYSEEGVMRLRLCLGCGRRFYTEEFETEDNSGFRYVWAMNMRKRRAKKKEGK